MEFNPIFETTKYRLRDNCDGHFSYKLNSEYPCTLLIRHDCSLIELRQDDFTTTISSDSLLKMTILDAVHVSIDGNDYILIRTFDGNCHLWLYSLDGKLQKLGLNIPNEKDTLLFVCNSVQKTCYFVITFGLKCFIGGIVTEESFFWHEIELESCIGSDVDSDGSDSGDLVIIIDDYSSFVEIFCSDSITFFIGTKKGLIELWELKDEIISFKSSFITNSEITRMIFDSFSLFVCNSMCF
jgi:hypothetical protein